ncbi:MAG TPA: hypothetical protein VIK59_07590 [Verrucomicrobiae bacterium]
MNLSFEQIQIVKTLVTEFLPVDGSPTSAEKILETVLKYAVGNANKAATHCEIRNMLTETNQQIDDDRVNLCVETASRLIHGCFRWMQGQENADELDIYPALQLSDCYHHAEPVDWLQKWRDNGGQVFARNEMIALKNDPVWIRISAFGLPFPPFDLDSGMDVDAVPRNEAEKLGLLSQKEQVGPTIVDLNFGLALRQRLAEYFSPEVKAEKIKNLERALEEGFDLDFQRQATAYESLVEAFEFTANSAKANYYREKQLDSLKSWVEQIPTECYGRAPVYSKIAKIYDDLGQPEQSATYRQLEQDNQDGFTLLSEALDEWNRSEKPIEKEKGAGILDMLTKAAQRLPEKYQRQHAMIYRATGEILEAWGDTAQAIEYYEFALQKDPKVGAKKRLKTLREKL